MTNPEELATTKATVIAALEQSAKEVCDALEGATPEQLTQKPGPDKWSARDVVCHILDTETLIFAMRVRKFESEESPYFPDIDHSPWEAAHDYTWKDTAAALQEFLEARADFIALIRRLPDEVWARTGQREFLGPVKAADVAAYCAKHTGVHAAQIRRTLAAVGSRAD